ncbi:ankyrin repeat-containing domain protein [Aspergillus carlsbadensis]|nr:ankyrin repeat-containing domain protein [Aspergillus carlsbadensis]
MSTKGELRQNLWTAAYESLTIDDKTRLRKYQSGKALDTADEALEAVRAKQTSCLERRWTIKTNARSRIIVRDVLQKIGRWISKFKEIGDVAVQYNPENASLPWAGLLLLLKLSANDLETFAPVAEGLETVSRLTVKYAIFESVYLPGIGEELTAAQIKLCDSLIVLYRELLTHLVNTGRYYERPTGTRIVQSLYAPSHCDQIPLKAILDREDEIQQYAHMVQAERSFKLQQDSSESLKYLNALLTSLETPMMRLTETANVLQESLDTEERKRVLAWLSADDYRGHHESTREGIVPNTAQWILTNPRYQAWQHLSACSILLLHGIAGCGKTKLTSRVIQRHLDTMKVNSHVAPIAYAYCSSTNSPHPTSPLMVLRSLVKQLAIDVSGDRIRKPIWEEYARREKASRRDVVDPSPLSVDECIDMLLKLTSDSPATIVIDGLDELDGDPVDLLSALHRLNTESLTIVKIMISSREDARIKQELLGAVSVSMSAGENSADIGEFIQHRVDLAISNRKLLGGKVSEEFRAILVKTLKDGANGMFLWPAMQLEYLCDHRVFKLESDVRAALTSFPPTLANTFERMYSRILTYSDHGRAIATRTFSWLLASERRLSEWELITAVRINEDQNMLKLDTASIVDLCSNFIDVDGPFGRLSFVHASIRKYLQSLPEYSASPTHFTAAQRCLESFLSDEDDATIGGEPISSFRTYAICNWARHYRRVADPKMTRVLEDILRRFVTADGRLVFEQWLDDVAVVIEADLAPAPQLKQLNALLNDQKSPMFLSCVYGVPFILEVIEAEASETATTVDWNAKNSHGESMIYVGAKYGHGEIVKFLASRGAKVDCTGGHLGNPLQAAAFYGHEDAVRGLIEANADLYAHVIFASALDAAVDGGHEKVIQAILEHSSTMTESDLERVLLRASYDGHHNVVTDLLKRLGRKGMDGEKELNDDPLHIALQMALFQGHARISKTLLSQIRDINIETSHFGNALQAAAFGGRVKMVQMVLDRGADVNSRGRYGTPLRAAALGGHDAVVNLLIEQGATAKGKNANALQAAAFHGHLSTVGLLLESDLYDCSDYSPFVKAAVDVASFRGHLEVTRLLLETYGIKAAHAAFSAAVNAGHEMIVRLALETDPQIDDSEGPDGPGLLRSTSGSLPLFPEADGPQDLLQEAATAEVTIDSPSRLHFRLPWIVLEDWSVMGEAEMSRSTTVNRDILMGNGRLLRMAARNGDLHALAHLIERRGCDMNSTGDPGGPYSEQSTPIEVAAAAGQTDVVKYLLEMGAEVGRALSYAVRAQSLDVMDLIIRMCPHIKVDEPVHDKVYYRESDYCDFTSPIAVAVAWKFLQGLDLLLDHGRRTSKLIIGQGLVVAAGKQNLDAMRMILHGFQLAGQSDDSFPFSQQYSAFLVAAKQAALERDIRIVQVLLEHMPTISLKEKFLGRFVIDAIADARWYEALLEIRALVDSRTYECVAGKALIGLAAERDSARQSSEFAEVRPVLWRELQRMSEISSVFAGSYQEAFHEAAKYGNVEMARVLLGKEGGQWALQVTAHSIPGIDLVDGDGNPPLYYACANGYLELFELLIEGGADILTRHSPVRPPRDATAEAQEPIINLLQVTLDSRLESEYYDNVPGIWCRPLRDSWGLIIMYLLEAGLAVDMNYPALIKFFHIACFQGEVSYMQSLVARGISLTGPGPIGTGGDKMFGSAIHAAAFGGQMPVVQYLVEHGSDVRAEADCDIFQGVKAQTPIMAALEFRAFPPPTSDAAVLETCLYLVNAGALEEDAEALLERACKDGNVEVVKSLLRRGTRVKIAPSVASRQVYQALTDAGYILPSNHESIAELQRLAVEQGDLPFLEILLAEHGLQIRDVLCAVLRSQAKAEVIIDLLIDECSLDINAIHRTPHRFDSTKEVPETLLYQAACSWHDPELVEVLLQRGANPDSPGLPLTPLVAFLQMVSSGVNNWWDAGTDLRIARLLLDYGADPNGTSTGMIERTPLSLAVFWKAPEALDIVTHLIDKGADVNRGRISPLHLAYCSKQDSIADLLRRNGAEDHCDATYSAKSFAREVRRDVYEDFWASTRNFSDDEDSDSE